MLLNLTAARDGSLLGNPVWRLTTADGGRLPEHRFSKVQSPAIRCTPDIYKLVQHGHGATKPAYAWCDLMISLPVQLNQRALEVAAICPLYLFPSALQRKAVLLSAAMPGRKGEEPDFQSFSATILDVARAGVRGGGDAGRLQYAAPHHRLYK